MVRGKLIGVHGKNYKDRKSKVDLAFEIFGFSIKRYLLGKPGDYSSSQKVYVPGF